MLSETCRTRTPVRQDGLTDDQAQTLSARVVTDPAFRAQLLRDPQATARTLGLELADWEREEIACFADQIREHGRKIDSILRQPGSTMLIPVIVLR